MYESKIAPTIKECSRDCLILAAQRDRQKISGETVNVREAAESSAAVALETLLGDNTNYALEFIQIMSEQGMPGADILCKTACEARSPSFLGKLVGRNPEITPGAAVYGYPIGTFKITGEGLWRGSLYLGGDGHLWTHEDATSEGLTDRAKIVTKLDHTTVRFGQVFQRDNPKEMWSRYHIQDESEFYEMPVKDVLYEIAQSNLTSVEPSHV